MNEFEAELSKFKEESLEIQKVERELRLRTEVFNEKFSGFMRGNGLSENFTLPELATLVAKKAKE